MNSTEVTVLFCINCLVDKTFYSIFKNCQKFWQNWVWATQSKNSYWSISSSHWPTKIMARTTKGDTYPSFQISQSQNTAHLKHQQNKMEHCLEKNGWKCKRKKWMQGRRETNQREAGKCLVVCYGTDNALLSGALVHRWMQSAHTMAIKTSLSRWNDETR